MLGGGPGVAFLVGSRREALLVREGVAEAGDPAGRTAPAHPSERLEGGAGREAAQLRVPEAPAGQEVQGAIAEGETPGLALAQITFGHLGSPSGVGTPATLAQG